MMTGNWFLHPRAITIVLTVPRFYYDAISYGGPWTQQLSVRSLVGLIPLYAVLTLEPELINKFPSFKRRLNWVRLYPIDV